jgi:lysyl-tRNA synthetase class 2
MSPGSRNKTPSGQQAVWAAKKPKLTLRAEINHTIRRFFAEQGYLEVETPHLVAELAPELHIDAIRAGNAFLHTSPELCMKRLLACGYSKIFQICRCFRKDERGDYHLSEFTLLEWYRTEADYQALMTECEEMICFLCRALGLDERFEYQALRVDLQRPWERMSVSEAFRQYASVSLAEALVADRFDEIMVTEIEPHLRRSNPVFLFDYPASHAALARLKKDDPRVAERFELYLAGIELANAFSELTDPKEQRQRFEAERLKQRHHGKAVYPMPARFLNALPEMPDAAGIAFGIDRLVMVLANAARIDEVVCFTPEEV